MGEFGAVKSDVARRAHFRRDADRVAELALGGIHLAVEYLHLGSCAVRLRESVRDAQLAADRLRPLEAVACLIKFTETWVQVRASKECVGFDCKKSAYLGPGEFFVEEREHFLNRRPPEQHCSADFVPRLDLTPSVARRDCVFTTLLERHELRAVLVRGQFGDTHELPGIREVCVAADRVEYGDSPLCDLA